MLHRTHPRRIAVGLALSLALVTAACGDDDTATADDPTTMPSVGGMKNLGSDIPDEACDAYVDLSGAMAGDPAAAGEVIDTFVATAPDELAEAAETMGATYHQLMEGGDPSLFSEEDFVLASSEVATAYLGGCSTVKVLDIKGVDYGFEGIPDEVPAGRVGIRFTNATEHDEPHEMVLFKRGAGVTEPVEELLELPEEEAMAKLQMAGVVFADHADQEVNAMFDLETGSYIAICFIPIGGEDGPPHFTGGMVAEFDVA